MNASGIVRRLAGKYGRDVSARRRLGAGRQADSTPVTSDQRGSRRERTIPFGARYDIVIVQAEVSFPAVIELEA